MIYPYYVPEIIGLEGELLQRAEDVISVQWARAFNTDGSATVVLPNLYDRSIFRLHTRMRLLRYNYTGKPSIVGDTTWFLKKIDDSITDGTLTLSFVDAFAMLDSRVVAYTAQTPYADKTLEEFQLIVYNNSLRLDTMMLAYMRENFGELVLDGPRNNGFIDIERNKFLGPYGEKQAAWQQMGSVLQDLARQAAANGMNLYYDLQPIESGRFLFKIWSKVRGTDRGSQSSQNLVLTDTSGLIDDIHEIEDFTDVATVCYALGFDSGPSQVIQKVASPLWLQNDPFSRVEMTVNATDSDIPSVLRAAAQAALNGRRPKRIVTAKVVENSALDYDTDLSYGDVLSIEVAGRKVDVAVDAVSGTWDSDGEDLDIRLSGEEAIGAILEGGPADPGVPLPGGVNTRPIANAGPDQTVDLGMAVILDGSGVDDGLPNPPATLTYVWSQVSGPGAVAFGDVTNPATVATMTLSGEYVLRLTVSDSLLNDDDEMTITVEPYIPIPPFTGLRPSMERVGGMSQYHWYRTDDFQTREIEGGPTWTRHDVAASDAEKIYSYVVNPFSVGYLVGTGEVNAFIAMGDKIVQVTDLFGTVARTTLLAFPVALSADTHWRTIQASFGAFFEAGNPWLLCVSYYGATVGHTGTWATRSVDGGATWSAEVQISPYFDTSLAAAQPVAVFTSPRTPGFAMTVAFTVTTAPAESDIYITRDWGATWIAASAVVPAVPMPEIEIPDGGGGGGGGAISALAIGADGPTVVDNPNLYITPPAGAASMRVRVIYTTRTWRMSPGHATALGALELGSEGLLSHSVEESTDYPPGVAGSGGGTRLVRWDIGGVGKARIGAWAGANKVGTSIAAASVFVRAYVTEITMDDDTVVIPPLIPIIGTEHGQGGSMHIPWLDEGEATLFFGSINRAANRLLTLKAVTGVAAQNASPNDGTRDFGTFFGPFGIRTYDSDLRYALLGARGNDTATGATDDVVGLYLTQDGGMAGWTQLLAPVDEANVHMGIQAAFSGTDPKILFAWGGWTDGALAAIYYSRDLGLHMDNREGNLPALEDAAFGDHISFIGIAGGPPDDEPAPPEGDDSVWANPKYFYGDMKAFVLWDGTDVLRTWDVQADPPTWAKIDTGISGTIKDGKWVVIDDTHLGMWLLTSAGVFWCQDILATTPSWTIVLPIATVRASDSAPVTGQFAVEFMGMAVYDMEPGYCIVATAPVDDAVNPAGYMHSYFWHTHDYGATWTSVDMNAFTYTSNSITRCYYNMGVFGMDIFRKAPGTIWAMRETSRTSTQTGQAAVFKSEDLGHTWTQEYTSTNWSKISDQAALAAPWPYLNSPSYYSRATGNSGLNWSARKSTDGWATSVLLTPPTNHQVVFGNNQMIQRISRRATDENHLISILLQTTPLSSGGPLQESYDQGATWTELIAIATVGNEHTNPTPWPLDPYQWAFIRNSPSGNPQIDITMDNFATLESREGNINSVISGGTWAAGAGNGFPLPKLGVNV